MSQNVLMGFSLFVEGRGHAGDVSKVDFPDIELKTEEFQAGGWTAPIEVVLGRLAKALEIETTYNTYTPDVMKQTTVSPNTHFSYVFRGAYKTPEGKIVTRKVTAKAVAKTIKEEAWEPGKKVSMTTKLTCNYYRDEWEGVVSNEVDPTNCGLIIDGVDHGAGLREALGI